MTMKKATKYIPVGGETIVRGEKYICEVRGLTGVAPKDACEGCDLNEEGGCKSQSLQCSKFDRKDNQFVKFLKA